MCLIAIAGKGTDKYKEMFIEGLITSSKTNKDGAGFAYKKHGEAAVFYQKGYTNTEDLINDLRALDLKKEDELIVHLRRMSSGPSTRINHHPFILSSIDKNIDDLGPAKTHNDVLFHNGHFKDFVDPLHVHSDTYMFVKNFMRCFDMKTMLRDNKEVFEQIFKPILLQNKIAILSTMKGIITVGTFVEENGYFFSNMTYKTEKITDTGGTASFIQDKRDKYHKFDNKLYEFIDFHKTKDGTKSDNIIINSNNFNELVLECIKANEDLELGSQWKIYTFDPEKELQCIHTLSNDALFIWIDLKQLMNDFKCRPALAFQNKYKDYYRLKNIVVPTKTAIKKINNRIKKYTTKKDFKTTDYVSIEYKNRMINDLRYDAVLMFIEENIKYLNGPVHKVLSLLKKKEVVVDAETNITKLGLDENGIVDLNNKVAKKVRDYKKLKEQEVIKLANKNLEKFTKERKKELDFEVVDKAIQVMEERTCKLKEEVIGESKSRTSWNKNNPLVSKGALL